MIDNGYETTSLHDDHVYVCLCDKAITKYIKTYIRVVRRRWRGDEVIAYEVGTPEWGTEWHGINDLAPVTKGEW